MAFLGARPLNAVEELGKCSVHFHTHWRLSQFVISPRTKSATLKCRAGDRMKFAKKTQALRSISQHL